MLWYIGELVQDTIHSREHTKNVRTFHWYSWGGGGSRKATPIDYLLGKKKTTHFLLIFQLTHTWIDKISTAVLFMSVLTAWNTSGQIAQRKNIPQVNIWFPAKGRDCYFAPVCKLEMHKWKHGRFVWKTAHKNFKKPGVIWNQTHYTNKRQHTPGLA